MTSYSKKLIISPHADDEVLGCFSVMDADTDVAIISINEDELKYQNRPSFKDREDEVSKLYKHLNYKVGHCVLTHFPVCYYQVRNCIETIEECINERQPHEIYIPTPISYNQDHKVVYEACMVALRPHDKNWFVSKVLVYEQPHTFLWSDEQFKPQYFRKLDIKKKLEAYSLYETQVRSFRSHDTITSIAKLRGKQSNQNYAEAFEIRRWA